MIEHKRWA